MRGPAGTNAGRALLGSALLSLCVLASACGGSAGDGTGGVASAGDGTARSAGDRKKTDPQQAGLDFARCMREHGVDVPDPKPGDGGLVVLGPGPGPGGGAVDLGATPPAGFEEANHACRHFLEDLIQDGAGAIDPKEQDRALRFARCMREHGVSMPDPDFSKGGAQIQIGDGFDPTSETFKAAQKACGSLFGPGTGPAPAPAGRSGARS